MYVLDISSAQYMMEGHEEPVNLHLVLIMRRKEIQIKINF
jgi:hypothetical protein